MFEGLVPSCCSGKTRRCGVIGGVSLEVGLSFPHARSSLSSFLSPYLLSVAYRSGYKLLATAPVPFSHHDDHRLILSNCKQAPSLILSLISFLDIVPCHSNTITKVTSLFATIFSATLAHHPCVDMHKPSFRIRELAVPVLGTCFPHIFSKCSLLQAPAQMPCILSVKQHTL